MKAKLLVTLAGAGLILMLVLALTAGAAVQADSRLNQAPPLVSGDRYVATTGDDTMNTCTDPANPCQTVGYALGLAQAGETIRVAAGTYLENVQITQALTVLGGYSGPPDWVRDLGQYKTILHSGSSRTTASSHGEKAGGATLLGAPVVTFATGSGGAVLDGFTVTGGDGQGGIRVDAAATVANCTVTDNRNDASWGGGISLDNGAAVLIQYTEIISNVSGSAGGLAVMHGSSARLVDSVVAENWTYGGAGGGIGLWWGAVLTATGSLIRDNNAGVGGGMEVSDEASAILENTGVMSNTAQDEGGGIRVAKGSSLVFTDGRLEGNQAQGIGGGLGIDDWSAVQILGSEILNNTAQNSGGGADVSNGSHLTMENVEVRGNHAVTDEGGGLMFHDDGTEGHLTNVQVVENQADGGGGISLTSGPNVLLVLDRVEIARNVARWGAGLRPYQCTVTGDRVWIADNVATEDNCGGFSAGSSDVSLTNAWIVGNAGNAGCFDTGTLALTNVTVAGNTRGAGWGGLAIHNGSATIRNSVLFYNGNGDVQCDPGTTCTVEYSDLEHPWAGTGNISADPLFVDRAGGDYHLLNISPCIDQASLDYAPDHDIDGEPRPFDGDGDGLALPDMGADEWTGFRIFLPLVFRSFGP